jgi:hypothetical protein
VPAPRMTLNVTTEWSESVASHSTESGGCAAASPQIRLSPSDTIFVPANPTAKHNAHFHTGLGMGRKPLLSSSDALSDATDVWGWGMQGWRSLTIDLEQHHLIALLDESRVSDDAFCTNDEGGCGLLARIGFGCLRPNLKSGAERHTLLSGHDKFWRHNLHRSSHDVKRPQQN